MVKCPMCGHEFDEELVAVVDRILSGLRHKGTIATIKEGATYITGRLDTGHGFTMILDKDKRLLAYRREEKTDC